MKFQFKVQQYQTEAVERLANVFAGQAFAEPGKYRRDVAPAEKQVATRDYDLFAGTDNDGTGKAKARASQEEQEQEESTDPTLGFRNAAIELKDADLLKNIRNLQRAHNIQQSDKLHKELGRCALDVEMETGTGKTYVYIKTIFELNKRYGWTKFIVVVPSIAIREGVKKSFEITSEHFMEHYNKKARFFIYDSSKLDQIDAYSASSSINVMIINTQAFASSLKEGGRSRDSLIMYSERDSFGSRRPIDVLRANRPILILDEPQKMEGKATQEALKNFHPLFCMNFSATHRSQKNLVYVLDALDAYNKRLVKKIEVKGIQINNLHGTDKYMYLDSIVLSGKSAPKARLEYEVKRASGEIRRETRLLEEGDDLYHKSGQLEQYKDGFVISDINPIDGYIQFTNGLSLSKGDVSRDINEKDLRRIQIRETILSHFEKERTLFASGIKTLSLFFIGEVASYRQYDENGEKLQGEFATIFEEEYQAALEQQLGLGVDDPAYQNYLNAHPVERIHEGYFSIDKKGRSVDSALKRNSDVSDDVSAYDLILKQKERLLSLDEPVRFIFSHSALREGWDNPNVFQICTLKHADSAIVKRQEVGRGLRLCVNQNGTRMDADLLGERGVHDLNVLTVVASESYATFVGDLQSQIKADLYQRPKKASEEYFTGKVVHNGEDELELNADHAKQLMRYLIKNDYVDDHDLITDKFREDLANETLATLPEELAPFAEGVQQLVTSIYNESVFKDLFSDGNKTKVLENNLNKNFHKKEFQELWERINRRFAYTVSFDSDELIDKAVCHVNTHLWVNKVVVLVTKGNQMNRLNEDDLSKGTGFRIGKTKREHLNKSDDSSIRYDLVGKIATATKLTRKTTVKILQGLKPSTFAMFAMNPEEFIDKTSRLINEQKASMVVEHIQYNPTDKTYDASIFTTENSPQSLEKAYAAQKHIQDYVYVDGLVTNSIERRFAQDMDKAEEVCVYAKLPKGFAIPTPVGNYSPDWAIAFNKGSVKHIFFVAETKGSMDSLQLRPIESAKIACAKKLFNSISNSDVRYHEVDSYSTLMGIMNQLD